MENMFCFQCEQTAKGTGCTVSGVCGKKPEVSHEQDVLTCEMIALAKALTDKNTTCQECVDLICDGLFTTITNVSFDAERLGKMSAAIKAKRESLGSCCGVMSKISGLFGGGKDKNGLALSTHDLFHGDPNVISLRSTLLFGLRGMAAYAHHARALGKRDPEVDAWLVKGMAALAEDHSVDEWLGLLMEFGGVNLKCMALLDGANTGAYGNPVPTQVPLKIEKGPFIVVTGHDLYDLKMLLEQTDGKGVNIYTHSEMLPAHGYPELKKYAHLKGNFGTAWQNQQKEFDGIPAPVLFTTNCLMPVKDSYRDRIFTTGQAGWPGAMHIADRPEGGAKDFSPLIERAKTCAPPTELEQGEIVGGFAHAQVMALADKVIEAVKSGAIKRFVVMGGCDGRHKQRSYYTDVARALPKEAVILTAGCAKYRYNKLDLGDIGGIPRLLDAGQCNDSYSLAYIALKLKEAFGLDDINELPISYDIAWYEQKAIIVLLALLHLGVKHIRLGPTLPAFLSPNVAKVLIENFDIKPIGEVEEDVRAMMAAA